MNGTTIAGLTALGASILRHFRHPDDWQDGAQTGNPRLSGSLVLAIDQLRLDDAPIAVKNRNQVIVLAIRAWASSVGIKPYELRFEIMPDAAYISVPWGFFSTRILPKLEELA